MIKNNIFIRFWIKIFGIAVKSLVLAAAVFVTKGDKTLANDEKHATKSDVCIYSSIIIVVGNGK